MNATASVKLVGYEGYSTKRHYPAPSVQYPFLLTPYLRLSFSKLFRVSPGSAACIEEGQIDHSKHAFLRKELTHSLIFASASLVVSGRVFNVVAFGQAFVVAVTHLYRSVLCTQ